MKSIIAVTGACCWVLSTTTTTTTTVDAFSATPAAYGIGKEGFDKYRATLPKGFNVVSEGGWYALTERYSEEVGKKNYDLYKSALPKDLNVVALGGYHTLQTLSADPKAELVNLILNNIRDSNGKFDYTDSGKIDALVTILQSRGKGFNSLSVDGEWTPVLSRQGKASKKIQQFFDKGSKILKAFSNFDAKNMTFENINYVLGKGVLKAGLKYVPVPDNFSKSIDGKIVLRRISCDIVQASWKYWKLPTIPLPLKKKGGYLDFLYLDNDIRVTRGNNGGLFVHFRPKYLQKLMSGGDKKSKE